MTLRRLSIPLVLVLLPAAPAAASPPASARIDGCDPAARTVRFAGAMHELPGGARMQMRFTLQVREDGWERVAAPTFGPWTSSAAGKLGYVYSKQVQDLTPGSYRVVVRFRWRAADGKVLRTAKRRSRPCVVPDDRADLAPLRIRVAPGPTAGTQVYSVLVANRGRSVSDAFSVGLAVDGVPLPDQPVAGLAAHERTTVVFTGPVCDHADDMIVAGVDTEGLVDEAEEADDILSLACEDL